jgi:hypothetical protein
MLDGKLDLAALPLAAEYYQITDIDTLISDLLQIKKFHHDMRDEK